MVTNIEFIELTKAAWPKDISSNSQAWLTDKLNETLDRLKYLQQAVDDFIIKAEKTLKQS